MKATPCICRGIILVALFLVAACDGFEDQPNNAPVISGTPAVNATEDSVYSDNSITATDEDGDSISYSISGPSWLSIDESTGALVGTPLNANVGDNAFTITATDTENAIDTLDVVITVANTNDAPVVVSAVPDQVVTFGFADYDLDLSIYLSDPDVSDTPVYSVTNNSDATTIGTAIVGSVLTLSHKLSNSNVISLTVRITDGSSAAFVEDTFTVNFPPVYYTTGFYWNDYVKNDGADRFSASDTACDGMETGGYDACIHAGEVRFFDTGLTDACAGLSAADALGAFDWVCDDSGATTVFYSSGLAEGKKLSDLIDFNATPVDWKNNQLVVTGGAGFQSVSMKWWENPIVEDNDGMIAGNAMSRTIYVVTTDPQATYVIDSSNVGLVIKPGVTMTGTVATNETLVYVDAQDYIWLEGVLDATDDDIGIYYNGVKFSVIREVDVTNGGVFGILLATSSANNMLREVVAKNTYNGISIQSSSKDNTILNATVSGNVASGIFIFSASDNYMYNITAYGNANGLKINNLSDGNSVYGLVATNNDTGVVISGSAASPIKNTVISGLTVFNSKYNGIEIGPFCKDSIISMITTSSNSDGISFIAASNNVVKGLTSNNNAYGGLGLSKIITYTSDKNTLSMMSLSNNGTAGASVFSSSDNIFSDLAVVSNGDYGINLSSSSSQNMFTGLLKVGNNVTDDCYVDAESTSGALMDDAGGVDGTHDGDCLVSAPSDFGTATTGVSVASSFVGKLTADDVANADDNNGSSNYPGDPAVFDWGGFDNGFRGWGIDGAVFPKADHRGQWTTGTGRIWDWSLKSTDTVLRNAVALPTGDDTLTHTWSDASTTTFLRNAIEISDDDVGNDNLLCESNEECLYMPNIASYQGHGNLISAGAFVDGAITGVTLWKYANNGY